MTQLRRGASSLSKISIIPQTSLGDDDHSLFSPIYISPCEAKVSNDAFADSIPLGDNIECLETSYECPREESAIQATTAGSSAEEIFEPREVEISYDYEMHYDASAEVEETLNSLQGSYLRHAAFVTGLLGCSVTAEFRNSNERFLQSSEDLLIGIKSEPGDQPDPNNSECIVPVQSSVTNGAKCVPVKGGMTLVVDPEITEEEEESIKKDMLKTLRQGMVENVYVSRDVRKVSFIGTRLSVGGGGSPGGIARGAENPNAGGVSAVSIGVICACSLLSLILLAMFVRRRQKRARNENMMRDMIFVDATVEAKEIAAAEADYDRESRGSLADQDELESQPDPIIEARPVERADESKEDTSQMGFIEDANTRSNDSDDMVPNPSSDSTFPAANDSSANHEDIPAGNSDELYEYENYDEDSVDSSLASLAASNSTASSVPSVPYASLADDSNEAQRGSQDGAEEDRLNVISENEEAVLESSVPNTRPIA